MNQLRQLCQERLTIMFNGKDRPFVAERLRQELDTVKTNGQIGAFENASEKVQQLKAQGVSCRLTGAGCCSLISYLMNFSGVDPTEHGLPYERFLQANSTGTIKFRFDANSHTNGSEEDFEAMLEEASCDVVNFQQSTSLSAIPCLVAQEIRQTDSDFDLTSIPLNDAAAFEILQSRDVEGISQCEGDSIRSLLPVLKPSCLTDIAAITGIQLGKIHEAGILDEYIYRGSKRKGQLSEGCCATEMLHETRGLILFQEQIMLIMNRVADIPMTDAYSFIKAVARRQWEQATTTKDWFIVQAVGNGVNEPEASRLFERIWDAATRAACMSHHLAEAVSTYQAAFLKAHFPNEFSRKLQIIQRRGTKTA